MRVLFIDHHLTQLVLGHFVLAVVEEKLPSWATEYADEEIHLHHLTQGQLVGAYLAILDGAFFGLRQVASEILVLEVHRHF